MVEQTVLVLGGGVNGAAAARELALNGVGVWLVDTADLAFGATAYSSRLIHGGLRYLEFAEFSLVKESLDERRRLLQLAPHLVKPLRLYIPVRNSWGGLTQAAGKFLRLPLKSKKSVHRGLRTVQVGLWLYDRFAGRGNLDPRSLHQPGEAGAPAVNLELAKWLWAYSDAQIIYPERLVIDFLSDARQLAAERGSEFRVLTYSRAVLRGDSVEIQRASDDVKIATFKPSAIINATGAWVDRTLERLPVTSRRLMGGTKGSHFVTYQPRLAELLAGQGVYTEARDGRPVFLLPFGTGTLVGTTDIPFTGDPATAVASEQEVDYLLSVVADVFPSAGLSRADITMHQCGVRPLPYVDAKTPAAITRRHQLVWNDDAGVPLLSLVGGKLTTCRSLAEETAAAVLARLSQPVERTSRDRPIPPTAVDDALSLPGAPLQSLSPAMIDRAIAEEWVTHLEDLVERRLMLHFSPDLTPQTLANLAAALVQHGKLAPAHVASSINRCTTRLRTHFGIQLKTEH